MPSPWKIFLTTMDQVIVLRDLIANSSEEIAQLAAECGIDWYALDNLELGMNKNPPVLHKKYKGTCSITVSEKTYESGKALFVRFHTFKHGDLTRNWSSFSKSHQTTKIDEKKRALELRKKRNKERKENKRRKELYEEYQELFRKAPPAEKSNYLDSKGISDIIGHIDLRKSSDNKGEFICFPLFNQRGVYLGLQRLYENGKKMLTTSTFSYNGAHAILGDPDESDKIYVTEGFATAASIYLATGQATVFAWSATNLNSVVAHIKSKYKETAKIIIAADNDISKEGNTGIYVALKASKQNRVKIVVPPTSTKADWNDIWQYYGDDTKELLEDKENSLRAATKKLDYTL